MKSTQDGTMNVLFISHGSGFPNGLAATQRMRLTASALRAAGVRAKILLTRVSERPPVITNTRTMGEWQGIPFEYTTGTTVRSDSFTRRRWADLKGAVGAVTAIFSCRRSREPSCVYLWICHWEDRTTFRALRGLCAALGVPVVCELNEPTLPVWEGASLSEGSGHHDPLLTHIDGFVAISAGLEEWVRSRKGGNRPQILRLPVLVDTDEVRPSFAHAVRNDVFYAAAPAYADEIGFVLDVVDAARERCPDLRVRFSGWEIGEVARPDLRDRLRSHVAAGSAIVEGSVPREGLLDAYRESAALLLPMKDESRSYARCPTKLGEYLASGRPVVATAIGELSALLSEGVNAFLAEPGSVSSFAEALLRALDDVEHSEAVGRAGRAVAEQVLDYRRYSGPLADFFDAVFAASSGAARRANAQRAATPHGVDTKTPQD